MVTLSQSDMESHKDDNHLLLWTFQITENASCIGSSLGPHSRALFVPKRYHNQKCAEEMSFVNMQKEKQNPLVIRHSAERAQGIALRSFEGELQQALSTVAG